MSGRSAAALMPEILEGLTPEEVAELQRLSQPIGGHLDGGTTSALTTLEVDGMPHTIVKVVEKRWRGHTAAVDNDIVGVDSLDVMITTHSAYRIGGRVFVDVRPQTSATARGSVKTLTIPPLALCVMRQSILKWEDCPSDAMHCFDALQDVPTNLREAFVRVVGAMVAACAWHDGEHGGCRQKAEGYVLHEPRDALGRGGAGFQEDVEVIHLLAQMGLVERIARDNASELSKWLFTARGMQTLKIGVEVTAPSPVLRYRRDVPLEDMLPYELVDYLDEKGWRCETLPAGFRATQLPCLDLAALALGEASQQVWYLRATATTLNHSYLEAPARWEELHNRGIKSILHLQPPKVYDEILDSTDQPLPLGDAVNSFCADGFGGFGAFADVEAGGAGFQPVVRRGGRSGRGGRRRRQTQKRGEQSENDGESEQEESDEEEKEELDKEAEEEEEEEKENEN